MHRFFISPEYIEIDPVTLPPDMAHQIVSVLRIVAGQHIILLDNLGFEYEVELVRSSGKEVTGRILEKRKAETEPFACISLYLCLSQREKFEWILQKCTEVGVTHFIPVISSRSLVQNLNGAQSKSVRWQKILREAAEQSGRAIIPLLSNARRFEQILADAKDFDLGLISWEREERQNIKNTLTSLTDQKRKQKPQIAILIGPEGGFTSDEVAAAIDSGWESVTLGPRILRMETAAIVASALTLYELGL